MPSLDDLRWVRHADGRCQTAGCQLGLALEAMAAAQEVGQVAERMSVDDVALWCGVGGHAFSGRDPGRQRVTVQQWDENAQEEKPVQVSACGEHARPLKIATRPQAAIPAGMPVTDPATARARGYDPEYVAWLEQRNGVGQPAPPDRFIAPGGPDA